MVHTWLPVDTSSYVLGVSVCLLVANPSLTLLVHTLAFGAWKVWGASDTSMSLWYLMIAVLVPGLSADIVSLCIGLEVLSLLVLLIVAVEDFNTLVVVQVVLTTVCWIVLLFALLAHQAGHSSLLSLYTILALVKLYLAPILGIYVGMYATMPWSIILLQAVFGVYSLLAFLESGLMTPLLGIFLCVSSALVLVFVMASSTTVVSYRQLLLLSYALLAALVGSSSFLPFLVEISVLQLLVYILIVFVLANACSRWNRYASANVAACSTTVVSLFVASGIPPSVMSLLKFLAYGSWVMSWSSGILVGLAAYMLVLLYLMTVRHVTDHAPGRLLVAPGQVDLALGALSATLLL